MLAVVFPHLATPLRLCVLYCFSCLISQKGDTVVDIGANIGVFGARVLSAVPGGDVHYYAVEPCPSTFKLLQQNLLGSDGEGQQNSFFHINEALSAPLQAAAADRSCPQYPGVRACPWLDEVGVMWCG